MGVFIALCCFLGEIIHRYLKRLANKQKMKYVEYHPDCIIGESHYTDARFLVIAGMIRKDGEYHSGWFVYDRDQKKYVDVDFSTTVHPYQIAKDRAGLLNHASSDHPYNQQVWEFIQN